MPRLLSYGLAALLGVCLVTCSSCNGNRGEATSSAAPTPPVRGPADPKDPELPEPAAELAGELAYVCEGNLRIADLGTGESRDLVSGGAVQGFDWSPDGEEVAVAMAGYPPVIKRVPVAGGEGETIAEVGLGGTEPRWSPTGLALAFVVDDPDAGGTVHVVALENPARPDGAADNGEEALAPSAPTFRVGANPSWSPDGRLVAYERDGAVWTLQADGTREAQVGLGTTARALGGWAPDSSRLTISGLDRAAEGTDIFVTRATSGARGESVTRGGRGDVLPTWSPDGDFIAFMRPLPVEDGEPEEAESAAAVSESAPAAEAAPAPMALWIVNVRSGQERQVTDEEVLLSAPCWSPDGLWVAFVSPADAAGGQRLMVVSRDGSTIRQVGEGVGLRGVRWRPSGSPDGTA